MQLLLEAGQRLVGALVVDPGPVGGIDVEHRRGGKPSGWAVGDRRAKADATARDGGQGPAPLKKLRNLSGEAQQKLQPAPLISGSLSRLRGVARAVVNAAVAVSPGTSAAPEE